MEPLRVVNATSPQTVHHVLIEDEFRHGSLPHALGDPDDRFHNELVGGICAKATNEVATENMRTYSTGRVAEIVGVSRMTLLRWLQGGKIPEPRRIRNAGIDARVWTDRDAKRAVKYRKGFYRKVWGRKKASGSK